MYDTDFAHLSLGKFSAMVEARLSLHLSGMLPSLKYYYMGNPAQWAMLICRLVHPFLRQDAVQGHLSSFVSRGSGKQRPLL